MSSRDGRLLLVISAPSGGGKSTLCRRLMADCDRMAYSVSCTTREPRGAEVDGRDYHFLTEADFEARVRRGEFLEHAVVHGHRYGTLRKTVEDALSGGLDVLMDIDVQGAGQIRDMVGRAGPGDPLKSAFVDIFLVPPSMEVLRQRLVDRREDSAEDIERRLEEAAKEMKRRDAYMHCVVNDDLERAYAELRSIMQGERMKRSSGNSDSNECN